jgi:hypothetical protein
VIGSVPYTLLCSDFEQYSCQDFCTVTQHSVARYAVSDPTECTNESSCSSYQIKKLHFSVGWATSRKIVVSVSDEVFIFFQVA